MLEGVVQRRGNAGATGGASGWATPGQRRGNGGATLSPYPYGVAPAFEGGANAEEKGAAYVSRVLNRKRGEDRRGDAATGATPTPFGSFPACRRYGSAMRLNFAVARLGEGATPATNSSGGATCPAHASEKESNP